MYYLQVILGEEVAAAKLTLFDLTKQLCDAVQTRAEQGEDLIFPSVFYDAYHPLNIILFEQTSTTELSYYQRVS